MDTEFLKEMINNNVAIIYSIIFVRIFFECRKKPTKNEHSMNKYNLMKLLSSFAILIASFLGLQTVELLFRYGYDSYFPTNILIIYDICIAVALVFSMIDLIGTALKQKRT